MTRWVPDKTESEWIGSESVATLLSRWQADHDVDDFTALVEIVHQPLARMAARSLRSVGIRDPGVCDDVVAAVLEHLFRLGTSGDAAASSAFDRRRADSPATVDPGWAFVRCIARSRARDAARSARRRDRLAAGYADSPTRPHATTIDEEVAAVAIDVERLYAAVAALDERSRRLVELLLDGKNQAVIAHVLGVCEGTVSRLRTKAIRRLRATLAATQRERERERETFSQRPRCVHRG